MEGLKNIPHNLELLGWDMNNGDLNGMCLPTYNADIAWHDLQLHRGPHYQYDNKVKAALKNLETECQKYCKDEAQELLLGKITSKVTLFKLKIKNWQVTLNASSPGLRQSIFNPSSAT
ncbi:MAG: AHH domain-containing protein [Saprospiraceae bacterium]